jgi:hypothetical protein
VTFIHSTTTVPLNRSGDVGRRTMMRVSYGAGDIGATVQRPSDGAAVARNAYAVPEAKNSCST